jgi:hypothetical protein
MFDVFRLLRFICKFFLCIEIRQCCAILRNGPNPGIGQLGSSPCDEGLRLLGRERCFLRFLSSALHFSERVEGFKKLAGDGGVVAHVHVPMLGRHGHECNADRVVRVEVFRAVLDYGARLISLCRGGDAQDGGLNAAGAEASPVCVSQAQDQRVFRGIVRLEGFAKAAEDFLVLMLVLLGQYDKGGGREPVLETGKPASLFAGVGFGSAFATVATIGRELPF